MHETLAEKLAMLSTLLVAAAAASVVSASAAMTKAECPCFTYGRYVEHVICTDQSLASVPLCVAKNITTLAIRTPTIPLVAQTVTRFTNLKKLYLEHVDSPRFSKDFFYALRKILVFKIYGTSLKNVEGVWFKHMSKIRTLILSYNKISALDPYVFSNLKHLEQVALDHNKLRTLPPSLFEGTALKELYIDENPFVCDCELPTFMQWARDHKVKIMEPTYCLNTKQRKRVNLDVLVHDENCIS